MDDKKKCTHKDHEGERLIDRSDFSKHKINKSGLRTYCRKCNSRVANKWNKDNPEKHTATQITYARNHPHVVRQRAAVDKAKKSGELIQQPCVICGDENTEAHHESREEINDLKVTWLCKPCHEERDEDKRKDIPLDEERYKITDENRILNG